jgi:hypothetical protein
MTQTTTKIVEALLAGVSVDRLKEPIRGLSPDDYRDLCCTLCCVREEVAVNCRECAKEINRLLTRSGSGGSPTNCKIYTASSGWCPLIDHTPLHLGKLNPISREL